MEKVAATDANILILGENGTGKEVAARTIHQMSQRHNSGFVHVDLGAITETLFESELFGHRKGAFTDAREDRVGRIEAADGGTLFLDEIGNVPIRMQPKLLTVLQQRKLIRLGSNEPRNFDVRLITATNLDMEEAVKEGKFRQDLLYRINTVEIVLPPLRERMEDLPILLEDMIQRFGNQYHKPLAAPSANVLQLLRKYHWPGNIRELQHAVERAVIMAEGERLVPEDFEFLLHKTDDFPGSNDYNLEHLEAWAIEKAIRKHQGNISHAAAELGLSRGAMYRRMEKYGIQP
jgi:DNA-binding NtrC family response regulator